MQERAEFSVTVADLEEGAREYVFPIRTEWLEAALDESDARPTRKEGELLVALTKSGKDVLVQGHVKACIEVPCARCLGPAEVTIDSHLAVLMVPQGHEQPEREEELSADQPDLVPYDGQTVILDDLVRDEVLLEIPMIPLCSPDCPGMSAHAETSAPPAVDPRLEPLTRWKLPKQ